jgi:hypothetical protein
VLLFLIVGTVCVVFDSRFSNLNIDLRSFFGIELFVGFRIFTGFKFKVEFPHELFFRLDSSFRFECLVTTSNSNLIRCHPYSPPILIFMAFCSC